MAYLNRNLKNAVVNDLKKKMVLVAGPRQCGKTTFARTLLKPLKGRYYSWDIDPDRRILRDLKMDEASHLWIFDELHKYKSWRNWLKGVYDFHRDNHLVLVTGSAKLQVYSRGGDSLQGRYFLHRLHPFTLSEYLGCPPSVDFEALPHAEAGAMQGAEEALNDLMQFGGFPEPLLAGSQKEADRWGLSYRSRLVREEVRSLENIREIDKLELLSDRLPDVVGSLLSMNSLREDLEVAFETVRHWLSVFENLYVSFRVPPFGAPKLKAVKKGQKLYLWNWPTIKEVGHRFENLVAFHLLRFCHWCEDVEGKRVELRYFRDTVHHEVDFILLKDNQPWIAIETKVGEKSLDKNLKYLLERVKIPYAFQLSLNSTNDWRAPDINGCRVRLMPASRFLLNLP